MAEFETITDEAFEKATARGKRRAPHAVKARFDRRRGRIVINLSNGLEVAFQPKDAQGLERASPDDLAEVRVMGAGHALHFPRLDADFSIPRLIEGFLGSTEWSRQAARAAASRQNGKLGGRPRKLAVAG